MLRHRIFPGFLLVVVLCATGFAAETRPRIISLYAAHTEVLLRLGARDSIIGVSRQESYSGPETEGWSAPAFTARDDVETFLAAEPDIVLMRPQHAAAGGRLKEALERAGVRVIALQVTRSEDLYGYWRELAGLVGREKEAEKIIAGFDARIQAHREAVAAQRRRPGVFVESIHREVKTFTPDSLPMWLVELAGGRNIATDAEPVMPGVIIASYGPERLLGKAEEVEVFVSQQGHMNRVSREVLRDRKIYSPLKAFRNGRVFQISEAVLARPTPSLLEGLEQLANWLSEGE